MRGSRKKLDVVRIPVGGGRRGGKRVQAGLRDSKTFAMYRASLGLLAGGDYEDISVSRFAKVGGCSVGAFYGRFSDKKLFLNFLIEETFLRATSRAENALGDGVARGLSIEKAAKKIAEHISGQFADAEFAGVVRAAVKLGFSDKKSRRAFDDYREAVTARAILLLAPYLRRGGEERVREAMQAAFGILTDTAISNSAALRPGSARMNEAVSGVIAKLAEAAGKSAGKLKEERSQEQANSKETKVTPWRTDEASRPKARKAHAL